MSDLLAVPVSMLLPIALGIYALAYVAGGLYYLEQRAPRIRDQFPEKRHLAVLAGYAALGIGILAAISVIAHFLNLTADARMGAVTAAMSGTAFWIYRIHVDLAPAHRVRDALLSIICLAVALLVAWWAQGL